MVCATRAGLPNYIYGIAREHAIGAEDWKLAFEGLCDEHAIEGIAVVVWKGGGREDVGLLDRQKGDTESFDASHCGWDGGTREKEFATANLVEKLPETGVA